MTMNNFNNIFKKFKNKNNLDFRSVKYYDHSYFYNAKASVYFNYDFAKKIVIDLNKFLEKEFGSRLVIYNLEIDIDSLKTQNLLTYVSNRIYDYINQAIKKCNYQNETGFRNCLNI